MRLLRTPWTSQPQVPVGIDWSNPICNGLQAAGANGFNNATLRPSSVSGTVTRSAGAVGVYSSYAASAYDRYDGNYYATQTGSQLAVCLTTNAAIGANTGVIGPSISTAGFYLKLNSSNLWRFSVYDGAQKDAADASPAVANKLETLVGTTNGTTAYLYRNGKQVASVAAGNATTSANAPLYVGTTSSTANPAIKIFVWGQWNRALSAAEVKSLSDNPWQIFAPVSRPIYIPVSAPTDSFIYVPRKYQRTSQPQQPVGIDRARYPIACVSTPDNIGWRTTGCADWSANNSASLAFGVANTGKVITTSGTGYWSRTSPFTTTGPITVGIVYTPTTTTGDEGIWSVASSATSTNPKYLLQRNGTNIRIYAAGAYQVTFTGVAVIGKPLNIVVTVLLNGDNYVNSAVGLCVNGVFSWSSSFTNGSGGTTEYLGSGYNGQSDGHYGLYFAGNFYAATTARELSLNPWQIFAPVSRPIYIPVTSTTDPRYARPNSDTSTGAWLPSSGTELFAMVDETTASDADYIYATTATICQMGLNPVDANVGYGKTLTIRAKSSTGSSLLVTLKQGSTTIATRTLTPSTSFADMTITLTSGEIASITDYTALSVVLESA